ncbi:MAG: hypothetical protein NZ519_07440 [Bacteroidia bacterium]|nr:hypothetical protein [Bacteroidia bacterium]MDW8301728.1 hypothetical protein [Bacteroidia bacterium]
MKKLFCLVFSVLLALLYVACSKRQAAKEYYQRIFDQEQKISQAMQHFSDALEKSMAESELSKKHLLDLEKAYQELGKAIEAAIKEVKSLKGMRNDENFQESAIALFEYYQKVHKEEYKMMIEICKKGRFTDQELQQMSLIAESIDKNGKSYEDKLKAAKAKFVQRYDLQ